MNLFAGGPGTTSLTADEQHALIPTLATRAELNEWERLNILEAYQWAVHPRNLKRNDILTERYIRELHHRMFNQTWSWAGIYRTTEKNIGVGHYLIRDMIAVLIGDVRFWLENNTYPRDESAVRFHHRLVWIHPFANGNGRHARLIADVLLRQQGIRTLTWGAGPTSDRQPGARRARLQKTRRKADFRRRYIDALQEADGQNIQPLLKFARS
jgi:Fic-DOC domain mobile mystery protein B